MRYDEKDIKNKDVDVYDGDKMTKRIIQGIAIVFCFILGISLTAIPEMGLSSPAEALTYIITIILMGLSLICAADPFSMLQLLSSRRAGYNTLLFYFILLILAYFFLLPLLKFFFGR